MATEFNFSVTEFYHHLSISHLSPDDGSSRPKHVVSEIIKMYFCVCMCVCVKVTSPFFVNTLCS
jgi:hypothetical protein